MERKKIILVSITAIVIVAVYMVAGGISPDYLKQLGLSMPLPLFTVIIALVDGFNPCNLFVLTLLMSLMLSQSHSRDKIYAVGLTFVAVVYAFYYMFMTAWLNIFQYIGFIEPLRIGIAALAIIAGIINCKELFFYRKGITLMIQDRNVGPMKRKVKELADMIDKAPIKTLIPAAAVLAAFASLVELPCTAGFPLIYTSILSGMALEGTMAYYIYLALYNLIYILPLTVIILVLGYTFQGRPISKEVMSYIKFVGGAIMLVLGIVLLVNPGLVGL